MVEKSREGEEYSSPPNFLPVKLRPTKYYIPTYNYREYFKVQLLQKMVQNEYIFFLFFFFGTTKFIVYIICI